MTLSQLTSAAAEEAPTDKTSTTTVAENNTNSTSGIEDFFKDSPSLTNPSVTENPQKDVKNDIMSLFEKVSDYYFYYYYYFKHILQEL